jgi:hypothetical protein
MCNQGLIHAVCLPYPRSTRHERSTLSGTSQARLPGVCETTTISHGTKHLMQLAEVAVSARHAAMPT